MAGVTEVAHIIHSIVTNPSLNTKASGMKELSDKELNIAQTLVKTIAVCHEACITDLQKPCLGDFFYLCFFQFASSEFANWAHTLRAWALEG